MAENGATITVTDENGKEVEWGFEGNAPPSLVRNGITGRTFKPGDVVSVMFSPLVDGRPGGAMCWVKVADGTYLRPADGGCGSRDPESQARWEKWACSNLRPFGSRPPSTGSERCNRSILRGMGRVERSNRASLLPLASHPPSRRPAGRGALAHPGLRGRQPAVGLRLRVRAQVPQPARRVRPADA